MNDGDLVFSDVQSNNTIKGTAYGDIGPSDEYKNKWGISTIIMIVLIMLIGLFVFLNKRMSKKLKIAIIAIVVLLGVLFIILSRFL